MGDLHASRPGDAVRLRAVTLGDVDLLALWASSPELRGEFNDFGVPPRPVTADMITNGGLIGDHGGSLMVERIAGSTPIGNVSWRLVRYGPNPESIVWNIGISLVPEARGLGFGSEAQRLLADYLFATTSVHRIEASTDVANLAEQRALERAGFSRDGVLRGAQYRAGAWHDLVVYSAIRTTEPPIRS
ncbi:MAG: GNAT family N-acetyltransferase [Candidatus Dormibacterales bacterium]